MSSALTTMTGAIPAHIQKLMGQGALANAALAAGVAASYPIISYKGKVWHVVEGGERILITVGEGKNANDPAASLEAVIVLANPNLNKVYYPDGYEEGSTERPLCHSDDGITPSNDAQEKQSAACGACPHNAWGSKISDNGSRGKACADSRRMAIASPDDIENPMLLRCPAASLKTLLAYGQQLDKRGWPYHAMVTRIGFDASLAYPSLTFSPERWLTEEELEKVSAMQEDDLTLQITALRPQPMADAPNTPTATQPEDAFARMEREAGGQTQAQPVVEPAAQPTVAATRKRAAKAKATPAEVAAAVQPTPQPQPQPQPEPEPEEAMHAAPARRGFGRAAAPAAPLQATAAPMTNGAGALSDEALSELDQALAGFDDEEGEVVDD
jgi:hypothetical protein